MRVAGVILAAMGALTTTAAVAEFPSALVWIMAAAAGTMFGAFAVILVSLILNARAAPRQHFLRLGLAFVFGLIIAPLVCAAYDPEPPKHIPIEAIYFALSGVFAFIAPAIAIALHKRSGSIADTVIDRVTTPQQARESKDRGESGRAGLFVIVLLGALVLFVYAFWDVFVLVWLMMTTQVH